MNKNSKFILFLCTINLITGQSLSQQSIQEDIHFLEAFHSDQFSYTPCDGFRDPGYYKIVSMRFTEGPPTSGKKNYARVEFQALKDIEIVKAKAKVYLGWFRVWSGTKRINYSFKGGKTIVKKEYMPFKWAPGGNYSGKVKVFGRGDLLLGCVNFKLKVEGGFSFF